MRHTMRSNVANSYIEVYSIFQQSGKLSLYIKSLFQIEIALTKMADQLFLTRKIKMFKLQAENLKLYSAQSSDYTVSA